MLQSHVAMEWLIYKDHRDLGGKQTTSLAARALESSSLSILHLFTLGTLDTNSDNTKIEMC